MNLKKICEIITYNFTTKHNFNLNKLTLINPLLAKVIKMNKTQEMQAFLDYFPSSFSIFEKDNDIELNSGNTIIDKDTLIFGFKEPGKKKIEFLCKHIINNFRVFRGVNNYNSENFINESHLESILNDFKDHLKSNKKRKQNKQKENNDDKKNDTMEKEEENKNKENEEIQNEIKNDTKIDTMKKEKENKNIQNEEIQQNEIKIDNKNMNWCFEWNIKIDNKSFICGQISNMNDLNQLVNQMKIFFEKKDEDKKEFNEHNVVNTNSITFKDDFTLELTEEDLKEIDLF